MATLPLTPIVDVIVDLSYRAAARRGFNTGLVIGSSADAGGNTFIPASERVRIYNAPVDMLEDGFTTASPEYRMALLYFAAKPIAPRQLAVGCWDAANSETALAAVQACRAANNEWYAFTVSGAMADQDILDIASYTESAVPSTVYAPTTASATNLDPADGGIIKQLKDLKYRRTLPMYSSIADASSALIGYAMGNNTGLAGSSYTLAYKALPGVTVEPLSQSQLNVLKANNGNVYINRGSYYDVFEQGTMADGVYFDEVISLDVLSNDITLNVMDLLYSIPKAPLTDPGVTQIIAAVNTACIKQVSTGFIAPGKWLGLPVLNLATGDYLPQGYLLQAESVNTLSQADRDARKSPPVYVAAKLAGAIEHVTVMVVANR